MSRRIVASAKRIEETMEIGLKRGLTPTAVSHNSDGTTIVHFGDVSANVKPQGSGWEDA